MKETPSQFIVRRLAEMELRQRQLAELSGVAQSTLSQYQNGDKVPGVAVMARLCAVLGPYTIEPEKRVLIPSDK